MFRRWRRWTGGSGRCGGGVFAGYLRGSKDRRFGNVLGVRRCGVEKAPVILLEAHIDEVGYLVTGIDTDGFVRVTKCGGADVRTAPASEVIVWGDRPYPGVFCSTPPHLSRGEEGRKYAQADQLGIDVGMDAAEAGGISFPATGYRFDPDSSGWPETPCAPNPWTTGRGLLPSFVVWIC